MVALLDDTLMTSIFNFDHIHDHLYIMAVYDYDFVLFFIVLS